MVAERFSVVAGENDDGIFALSCFLKRFDHSAELLVNELDHRVISGFEGLGIRCTDCIRLLSRCLR